MSSADGPLYVAGPATLNGNPITLSGTGVAQTLLPNGHFDFNLGNFTANPATAMMFMGDGVQLKGYGFDGTMFAPVTVPGLTLPVRYVKPHKNHLFVAAGSSVFASGLGMPCSFDTDSGAAELGTGDYVTGLATVPGTATAAALAVFGEGSTTILYGNSAADWNFVSFSTSSGSDNWGSQTLFDLFAKDSRGVTALSQTLNYANFDPSTLTYNVRDFILSKIGKTVCSAVDHTGSQYRVFFNDGYGLYSTVTNKQFIGHGIVLFHHPPTCMFDGRYSNGKYVCVFGTNDGYVMTNDVGTSFDGEQITAFMNTNINSVKSPRVNKRFRRCLLELQGDSYVEFEASYQFDWATERILPHEFTLTATAFAPVPQWDTMVWDHFYWDGRKNGVVEVELTGTGENLQMMISSVSDFLEAFTITSATFHYTPRRGVR
jgi:hypothetical protein